MYTQIAQIGLKAYASRELPAGALAFLLAEFFYKFHSFALECLAFLATWYCLSWILHKAACWRVARRRPVVR